MLSFIVNDAKNISYGMKYFSIQSHVRNVVLLLSIMVRTILSSIEDRNKPLDKTEYEVYENRVILITIVETILYMLL